MGQHTDWMAWQVLVVPLPLVFLGPVSFLVVKNWEDDG